MHHCIPTTTSYFVRTTQAVVPSLVELECVLRWSTMKPLSLSVPASETQLLFLLWERNRDSGFNGSIPFSSTQFYDTRMRLNTPNTGEPRARHW